MFIHQKILPEHRGATDFMHIVNDRAIHKAELSRRANKPGWKK